MSAYIIETLRQQPDSTILYYFCDHYLGDRNNCSHILRTLATQLIRHDPELAAFVWETHVRKAETPSIERLRKFLPKLIAASPFTRIVIDGIDECDAKDHKYALDQLLLLCKDIKGHGSLLLSSRDDGIISRKLRQYPTISLRDEYLAVERDIEAFIGGKFRQVIEEWDLEISTNIAAKIQQQLIQRSNGQSIRLLANFSSDSRA